MSHEFALNFNPTNPYCQGKFLFTSSNRVLLSCDMISVFFITVGIQGVVAAYQNAISQVKLYGPTNASPIINHVAKFAEQAAQDTKASVNVFSFDSFDAILVDIRNTWHIILYF